MQNAFVQSLKVELVGNSGGTLFLCKAVFSFSCILNLSTSSVLDFFNIGPANCSTGAIPSRRAPQKQR